MKHPILLRLARLLLVFSAAPTLASAQYDMPAKAIIAPPEATALAKSNNQFALDLYRQLSPAANDNVFFSPYSVSTSLAMAMVGAHNETAIQMAKVLHLAGFSAAALPPAFAALQKTLAEVQPSSGTELYIANSMWPELDQQHPLAPAYLSLVKTNFHADIFPIDFKSHADVAARYINDWVAENTKDKIRDIIHPSDLDASTRMVLVNTIYFKAPWLVPFQPQANVKGQFNLANGGSKPAVLMHQTFGGSHPGVGYADISDEAGGFQVLSLNYFGPPDTTAAGQGNAVAPNPYGRDTRLLSFIALLPRANDGLGAVEKALTADKLSTWLGRVKDYSEVEVFLPKFKLEERYNLSKTLKTMGMTDAFTHPVADFSGMDGTRDLYIGVVIHQTFIDVDEKGTEAAAATMVGMMAGGAPVNPPPPPPIFRADHPFLFLIRDNTTGSILFLGRLANPE